MKLPDVSPIRSCLQLYQWIGDPITYMETSAQRDGEIFYGQIRAKYKPVVFVSNPEAIEQILSNDTKEFTTPGYFNELLKPLGIF